MVEEKTTKPKTKIWPFCSNFGQIHLYADVLAEWVTAEMLNWGHLPLLPTSADVRLSQNMLPILESMPYG